MEYRNRGKRCRHKILEGIPCPGCNAKLMARHKGYEASHSGNIVNNHRGKGRKRIGEGEPGADYMLRRPPGSSGRLY